MGKLTKTFSPTLFGEFVFSWARWYYESFGLSNGFDPTSLGFPSYLAANSLALGFPSISRRAKCPDLGTYYNEHDVSDRYEGKVNIVEGRWVNIRSSSEECTDSVPTRPESSITAPVHIASPPHSRKVRILWSVIR